MHELNPWWVPAVLQGLIPMLADLVKRHIKYGVRVGGCWLASRAVLLPCFMQCSRKVHKLAMAQESLLRPSVDRALQGAGCGTDGNAGGASQHSPSFV